MKIPDKTCVICGVTFSTNKPNKVVCRREYCRVKNNRNNAARNYIKLKAERAIDEGESICPKCGKRHYGETKWEYCPAHKWLRNKSEF